MLFISAHHCVTVSSHVCILKERPDPSRDGVLRWSLPLEELCLCEAVVAHGREIVKTRANICGSEQPDDKLNGLWFVDDPRPLTTMYMYDWQTNELDQLMLRTAYCGKLHEYAFTYILKPSGACSDFFQLLYSTTTREGFSTSLILLYIKARDSSRSTYQVFQCSSLNYTKHKNAFTMSYGTVVDLAGNEPLLTIKHYRTLAKNRMVK